MFFSVITENLNWEILTENLVTFKRWDGVKDEKFWYYGGSLKNLIFTGGHENPIYRGNYQKGGHCPFADLGGGLAKKWWWCFWRWGVGGGAVIPQCTLLIRHYGINRPRSRRGHKYKFKNCLSVMIFICTKQLLSNIWSSIHEKLKQHWDWFEKNALLIKKACSFLA